MSSLARHYNFAHCVRLLCVDCAPVVMGTALSSATSRHHRRLHTDVPPPDGHYRAHPVHSSPTTSVAMTTMADRNRRDRFPVTSSPVIGEYSTSPPPSPAAPATTLTRQRSSRRSSKFFARFGLKSSKPTMNGVHCDQCRDCDISCLQVIVVVYAAER